MSPDAPHCTTRSPAPSDRFTYQVPLDGRKMTLSESESPSKSVAPHSETMARDFVAAAAQPVVSVTVTLSCTRPEAPARKLTLFVPAPDVIVPLVIAQS